MAVNILLADDHRMVREGIRCLLENVSEFNVVGEAADGYECISLVNKTKPNIVLLDIDMPDMNGIDTLRIIKEQKMICKVIMLTRHNEIDYLMKALEIGCDGYILKESSFETLLKAIFKVYSGNKYIEPNMMPLLNANLEEKSNVKKKISELTKREIDVIIQQDGKVIPIEVKSGNTRANSLKALLKNNKDIPYGYKFVDGNTGVSEDGIITLPLYMIAFI